MAEKGKKPDGRGKNPGRHPAQRPIPMRNDKPATGDPVPQAVTDALKLVDQIVECINEDVPEWKVLKNQEYFESTEERAKDIGETIRHTNRATDAQVTALENILAGVQKWAN